MLRATRGSSVCADEREHARQRGDPVFGLMWQPLDEPERIGFLHDLDRGGGPPHASQSCTSLSRPGRHRFQSSVATNRKRYRGRDFRSSRSCRLPVRCAPRPDSGFRRRNFKIAVE